MKFEIKGSTYELIQFVYFTEEDQKVTKEYKEDLYDRMYKLFGSAKSEDD